MKHNDGKETDIRMKHNDEKETDIRMSAEKSKERSIEKSIEKGKEKGKETNTEKNTDYRKKSHEMDMLNGSLALKMLIFAMPLAASSILQQLFNSADVAVAGRFAGSDALAAVGSNAAVGAFSGCECSCGPLYRPEQKRFHKQVCAYQREVCPYMRNSYACCGNVCGKTDS